MSIHHHLNDATLMAYAAGTLPESMNLVVATHLSLCPICRQKVEQMEVMGAGSLESEAPLPVGMEALSQVMNLIDLETDQGTPEPANDHIKSAFPSPLSQFVPKNYEDIPWRSTAPGLKSFILPGVQSHSGTVRLFKIAPGVTIPEHGHGGTELTLVLKGSFSDEIGRFKAGDIADLDDDIEHQPIADSAEDCICLIATEQPLRFKNMVPRIMQYFVGM